MRLYDPLYPLVALHIPKTGGTSIRELLQEWFPGERLFLHYKNGDHLPVKHELLGNCCVYGHFNGARGFGVEDYYPQAEQFMAFFREPFERFLSQWFYVSKHLQRSQDSPDLTEAVDFETWIVKRAEEQIRGCNRFSFVWQLPRRPGAEPIKEMFQKRFIFVGTIEHCVESMSCLATLLKRRPPLMVSHCKLPRQCDI
jgi:hypothetical protein